MWMRLVAPAIIVILLASAVAVHGSGLPWKADFPPADRLTGAGGAALPVTVGKAGGLTSVDFLGQVRQQLDVGRLISLFPFSWTGSAAQAAPDGAQFMGFSYVRVNATPLAGQFYYTGEEHGGRRIYVSATDRKPDGAPDHIFLKDGDRYVAYVIAGKPAVYAYVPYAAFNANETVPLGIANDGPVVVDLPNAAPFEVRRNESGAWRTIYAPFAAQVITPLAAGKRLTWHWDQRLDDGSQAPPGDYEAVIAGQYVAPFRLAGDTPVVEALEASVGRADIAALAAGPALEAFRGAYPDPSAGVKEDLASIMQYKAWALGLGPEQLRRAIVAAGDGLPCQAIHVRFEGEPAWIVFISPSQGSSAAGFRIVDDRTGQAR